MLFRSTNTTGWKKNFEDWFDALKIVLSGDVAAKLQIEIETIFNMLTTSEVCVNLADAEGNDLVTDDGDQLIAFWTLRTSDTCKCSDR